MEDYLGPVKTKKDDLFLKLVKRVRKPDYTMHFMEDRNGRKAMFYNYKGVEIFLNPKEHLNLLTLLQKNYNLKLLAL